MAKEKKLRIRLLSYDHRLLDESAKKIVEACKRTGAKVSGPFRYLQKRKYLQLFVHLISIKIVVNNLKDVHINV